jgi:hypothetical protein
MLYRSFVARPRFVVAEAFDGRTVYGGEWRILYLKLDMKDLLKKFRCQQEVDV